MSEVESVAPAVSVVSRMRPRTSGIAVGCGPSARRPVSAQASVLLRRADGLLSEAVGAGDPAERFRCAYLAALRGAAAVLAAAEGGARTAAARRPRSRSAWVLMARAAPEFAAWSDYFAEHSALRASVEAGVTRAVAAEDADLFYEEVGRFLTAVEDFLPRASHGGDRGVSA
ncbi:SAV_6107 family HEPN domain-containing protein [Rhodococcus sp. ACT016]|uniref:SAV_6107 family HEPN domain-containing protein n=1 Tax=Rhodococcus sp. ACT016 TaxID=3134808 RepID=UPI003D27AF8A